MNEALVAQVRAWIADDPDPNTQAELEALLAANQTTELDDRFRAHLSFGTAGLRGRIGGGPNRMNRAVVARITAGLCAHLRDSVPNATERGVCIAFDGRRMSRELAQEAAEVALGAGFMVHRFHSVAPTPLLAHAVSQLSAAAGIMITASHNPPAYNGYKAYGDNGAQVIAPHDAAVAHAATAVTSVRALPRVDLARGRTDHRVRDVDASVADHYFTRLTEATHALGVPHRKLVIAYTALHGVGEAFARRALSAAGFESVHSVAEQAEPDGAFPTVAFPNPEEPSAMERVMSLGQRVNADLVLANDPDADRLAVAARTLHGDLQVLTGNQVGLLLTDFLLQHTADPSRACVLSSIVTTPMVARVARAYGAHWEATLTGTKWICNRALELEASHGLRLAIGFEEAIGYCIGDNVHDKDGVGTALVVALMATHETTQGNTLHQALERIERQHGIAASRQKAVTLEGVDGSAKVASLLRSLVESRPKTLGGFTVQNVIDLSRGTALPPSPGVILELEHEHRVCIRPSGTEPKLKCYLDVRVEIARNEAYDSAKLRAEQLLDELSCAVESLL